MKRLESMFRDERTRKAARKAVKVAGAHAARGGLWAGRAAWRVARAAAHGLADHIRERCAAEPEAVARFDGEPFTRMVMGRDGGVAGVLVRPAVLTPVRAKWGDFLGVVSVLSLSAVGVGFVSLLNEPALYWWPVAAMGSWPFTRLLQKSWRDYLRIEAELMFTPARFSVRVNGAAVVFHDRQTPHKFRMRLHERAKDEAERDELIEAKARSRGNFIRRKKYYRDTYTLEFVDGRYPRPVLDIMGQREAERILARVSDVDDVMEQLVAMGDALAKGPEAEWDDMPGKIPEKV
jgi:hypothetical protein